MHALPGMNFLKFGFSLTTPRFSWNFLVFLPIYLLWISSHHIIHGELFTSMAGFEKALSEESLVLEAVERYIKRYEFKLKMLKKESAEINERFQTIETELKTIWNPISVYREIKKINNLMAAMRDHSEANAILKNITDHRKQNGVHFPTEEDVSGAAVGLFRLQDTYNLATEDISEGLIPGGGDSHKLTATQCFELGLEAYNLKNPDYYHALLWFQEAYDRYQTEENPEVSETDLLDYLTYTLYQQKNLHRAGFYTRRLKELDPDYPQVDENLAWYTKDLKEMGVDIDKLTEEKLPAVRFLRTYEKGFDFYESLCRGENNKKPTKDLHCYLKRTNPFLRLAPLKAEIIHRKPLMILFRQAVTPNESQVIRELGTLKLKRASIVNPQGELEPANFRISQSGWLLDNESLVVAQISRRIEDMTDLTCKTAEALQLANYGIGGHYEVHYDFAQKHETKHFKRVGAGNRIATVLFYLSQPTSGGATVFPSLSLTLYPTMNDAIVWYNLKKNGDGDMKLDHAACPVLSGVKWVANKWLHEYGQEFKRQCDLDESAYE